MVASSEVVVKPSGCPSLSVQAMYTEDSFFTLSGAGQTGLILLSIVLFVLVIYVADRVGGAVPRLVALGSAIVGFWLFEWLSPQIYYFYYLTLFDGLPMQSVIQTPPPPGKLLRIISFQDEQTLSAHSRGLLGWIMIVVALRQRRIRRTSFHQLQ